MAQTHIGAKAFAVLLGGNPIAARHMQRGAAGLSADYVRFVQVLSQDITDIAHLMQANPQRRNKLGEDALTDEIVLGLSVAGYSASHDTSSGGHVDVTVKLGPHSWIGEAKKDKNYTEGYKQLITRYRPASGNFGHDHGGMLLYYTGAGDLANHRNTWHQKFKKDFGVKYSDFQTIGCEYSQFAFFSRHKHPVSGTDFTVRHIVVGLQFQPEDASAVTSKKKAAARKAGASPASASVVPKNVRVKKSSS